MAKVPAAVWLVVSYMALAAAIGWSANRPADTFSTPVFFGCVLLSWMPAYLYLNRRDIAGNKTIWISQGAKMFAGLLAAAAVLYCRVEITDGPSRPPHFLEWRTWSAAFAAYFIASIFSADWVRWVARTVGKAVEDYLEKRKV